jgi:hypothetical protein
MNGAQRLCKWDSKQRSDLQARDYGDARNANKRQGETEAKTLQE